MKRIARLRIAGPYLRDALGLPVDAEITNARMVFEVNGDIELIVKHPDLPPVRPGELVPLALPIMRTVEGEPAFFKWVMI